MLLVWFGHGLDMVGHGLRRVLCMLFDWFSGGLRMVLAWLWYGLGMGLPCHWYGFGMG